MWHLTHFARNEVIKAFGDGYEARQARALLHEMIENIWSNIASDPSKEQWRELQQRHDGQILCRVHTSVKATTKRSTNDLIACV